MFVGRDLERRRIERLWSRSRVVVIIGAGGIGKTALMRAVVDELAKDAPVWMARAGEAAHVLDAAERALGLSRLATSAEDRAQRIAATVDASRGVVCLDDVHVLGVGEVRSVVRIAAHLRVGRVLMTARRRIDLGELALEATVVELGPLPADQAASLVSDGLQRRGCSGDAGALAARSGGSPLLCYLLAGGAEGLDAEYGGLLEGLPPALRDALEQLAAFHEAVSPSFAGVAPELAADLAARFLVERVAGDRVWVHGAVRDAVLQSDGVGARRERNRACARAYARLGPRGFEGLLRHLQAAGDVTALAEALEGGAAAWLWAEGRGDDLLRLIDLVASRGVALSSRLELQRALALAVQGRVGEVPRALEASPAGARNGAELLRLLARLDPPDATAVVPPARRPEYDRLLDAFVARGDAVVSSDALAALLRVLGGAPPTAEPSGPPPPRPVQPTLRVEAGPRVVEPVPSVVVAADRARRAAERIATASSHPPDGYDLWMDAATGRVVVDGRVRIDMRARPLLQRLLEVLLANPGSRFSKERLFREVWRLPYRAARRATVHKAVDRLARLLYPDEPKRFVAWDARGRLVLRAMRPCLVRKQTGDKVLNQRERWLVRELKKRRAISTREYRAALEIPRATAHRDLEHLVRLGLLCRVGKGRSVTYSLAQR